MSKRGGRKHITATRFNEQVARATPPTEGGDILKPNVIIPAKMSTTVDVGPEKINVVHPESVVVKLVPKPSKTWKALRILGYSFLVAIGTANVLLAANTINIRTRYLAQLKEQEANKEL